MNTAPTIPGIALAAPEFRALLPASFTREATTPLERFERARAVMDWISECERRTPGIARYMEACGCEFREHRDRLLSNIAAMREAAAVEFAAAVASVGAADGARQ